MEHIKISCLYYSTEYMRQNMNKLFENEIELDKEYGKVFFEYNVKEGAEKLHEFFKRIESLTASEVSDLEISPEDKCGNIESKFIFGTDKMYEIICRNIILKEYMSTHYEIKHVYQRCEEDNYFWRQHEHSGFLKIGNFEIQFNALRVKYNPEFTFDPLYLFIYKEYEKFPNYAVGFETFEEIEELAWPEKCVQVGCIEVSQKRRRTKNE